MDKKEALQGLIDLRSKVDEMLPFSGRAELRKSIQGSIDIIALYRPSGNIDLLLFKERQKDYELGVEIMNDKYKDREVKGEGSY